MDAKIPAPHMRQITPESKRQALEALTAGRLRALVDAQGVSPESRKKKADLIDALADGRRVDFEKVLDELKLVELKKICEALGLDDTGKVKADLVASLPAAQ